MQVGQFVEKIAVDYTGGRKGQIIQIGFPGKPERCRVHWISEKNGNTIGKNGIKTWCAPETLKLIK